MNAFANCTSLNCVAILNENVKYYSSFPNTPFAEKINEIKNSSGYCIDNNIYSTCDNETYTYIYNLNTPDICIKDQFIYSYYVTETNEE